MGVCCSYKRPVSLSSKQAPPVLEPIHYCSSSKNPSKAKTRTSLSSVSTSSEKAHPKVANSILRFKNGDYYIGDSLNNQPHGDGRYISVEGTCYTGSWKCGKPNGQGKELYPHNMGHFKGEYKNGVKNGFGKISFEDGSVYEGQLANDNIEGYGILFWPDLKVYRGLWKDNKMCGKGRMEWPNGMFYEGEYENDQKHGFGVFSWGKGHKMYIGFWQDGKLHGKGLMRNEKGEEFQGLWNNGKLLMKSSEEEGLDFKKIAKERGFGILF